MRSSAGRLHEQAAISGAKTSRSGDRSDINDALQRDGVPELPILKMMSFMGLWTMHVWIYWFNLTPLRRASAAASAMPGWINIYGVMTIALIGVCVVFARRGDASKKSAKLGRFDIPMTVLMVATVVSTAALGIVSPLSSSVACIWDAINVVAAGCCMAWGYARWMSIYARIDIRTAVICLFASYMIGSTIKILFDVLPQIVGAILAFWLPLISLYRLKLSAQALDAPDAMTSFGPTRSDIIYTRDNLGPLVRIAICVFVFALARALLPGTYSSLGHLIGHLIEIVFSAVVIVWVGRLQRALDFPQLWRFVFLFLTTGVALTCLGVGAPIAQLCSQVCTSLIVMLLWLVLADVAHHSDIHPYAVFGAGWCMYTGASYVGQLLRNIEAGQTLGSVEGAIALGIIALWVLGMLMVFVLETRSPDVQRIFADLQPKVTPEEFSTVDECCEAAASENGLTDRELDVLKLLAKGRTKGFIAEELNISENTVRGHARHIYEKLGVHSKNELQDRLGL